MSDSLRNRLQRHEEVPPSSTWNRIASRLDEEFSASDSRLSSRLEDVSIPAPSSGWEKISAALDGHETATSPVRHIPTLLKRSAIAAAIALVLLTASFYFFNAGNTTNSGGNSDLGNVVVPDPAPRRDSAEEPPLVPARDTSTQRAASVQQASVQRPRPSKKARAKPEIKPPPFTYDSYDGELEELQETRIAAPEPASALQPIAVSAPPIRDARGNIIMDMDIISKPGQQYITVTSPNGNQTRISSKFLNCLRYLNGNINKYEYDHDGIECQIKFDQWRNKLLSEAAFIPAGDNFFDIFELQDIIQD